MRDRFPGKEPNQSSRMQSAMEYLMTYGWAILVIAVVLGVMYYLGVFTPRGIGGACVPQPGYLCQSPILNSSGYLSLYFGQTEADQIIISAVACTNNESQPQSLQPLSPQLYAQRGQNDQIIVKCNGAAGPLGQQFNGYLWIQYSVGQQANLVGSFATISVQVSKLNESVNQIPSGSSTTAASSSTSTVGSTTSSTTILTTSSSTTSSTTTSTTSSTTTIPPEQATIMAIGSGSFSTIAQGSGPPTNEITFSIGGTETTFVSISGTGSVPTLGGTGGCTLNYGTTSTGTSGFVYIVLCINYPQGTHTITLTPAPSSLVYAVYVDPSGATSVSEDISDASLPASVSASSGLTDYFCAGETTNPISQSTVSWSTVISNVYGSVGYQTSDTCTIS